jgi:hypothetical protein
MYSVKSQPTFWRNMLPPSSGLKSKPCKKPERSRQHVMLNSSTLMMEAICSLKCRDDFQWTTKFFILEDRTLHNHCCENFKSYKKDSGLEATSVVQKHGTASVKRELKKKMTTVLNI